MKQYGVFFLLIAALGCSASAKPTPRLDADYPLRQDYLVVNALQATPSKWYEPGLPPLAALALPIEQMNADQQALLRDKEAKNILDGRTLLPAERSDIHKLLTQLFGTPEHPKLEPLNDEIRQATTELQLDATTLVHGAHLFQSYCANCHGTTGDGNGPGGKYLIPMPRDYRQGLFKFLTTEPIGSSKPQRSDLYKVITKGMDGSPMPAFAALSDSEVQAIISHVIYLSIRGETEYSVMKAILKDGEEDFEGELKRSYQKIVARWKFSNENPIVLDPNPYATEEQQLAAAANGWKIFNDANQGACTTCHVQYGKADNFKYDNWGTVVRSRNLWLPTLRGGRNPEAIYVRIAAGIPGVGMPSHAHLRPTTEERLKGTHRIWDLVYFVRFLSDSHKRQILQDKYGVTLE